MQHPEIENGQILVCCDGSEEAERAVDAAAALLGRRRAEPGAARGLRAGLDAEPRATIAPTTSQGIVDVADSPGVATHVRRPVLIVPPSTRRAV